MMRAEATKLLEILKPQLQFSIPCYQRQYSWKEPQCAQLLQDIIDSSEKSDTHIHFIGSVVYILPKAGLAAETPRYELIDGQQRLTTVSLLAKVLIDLKISNPELNLNTSAEQMRGIFLVNVHEEGDKKQKLILTRSDYKTFNSIVNDTPMSALDTPSLRVAANYDYFKRNVTIENAAQVYKGIKMLGVVHVSLENTDEPQLIFESLNSTGMDLSQSDLIRNFILMKLDPVTQTTLYETYWLEMENLFDNPFDNNRNSFDSFIRDYLTIKSDSSKVPRINEVYSCFKLINKGKSIDEIEVLVKEIHRFSTYYSNIALHREKNISIKGSIQNFSVLNIDVCYTFFMSVYEDYERGILDAKGFSEIIGLVESYLFRRTICNVPSAGTYRIFSALYGNLINKETNYLRSVNSRFA